MDFKNIFDLHKRLLPALLIQENTFNNKVSADDIWNYLAKNKWSVSKDLTLSKMVNDIFTCDFSLVLKYKDMGE